MLPAALTFNRLPLGVLRVCSHVESSCECRLPALALLPPVEARSRRTCGRDGLTITLTDLWDAAEDGFARLGRAAAAEDTSERAGDEASDETTTAGVCVLAESVVWFVERAKSTRGAGVASPAGGEPASTDARGRPTASGRVGRTRLSRSASVT